MDDLGEDDPADHEDEESDSDLGDDDEIEGEVEDDVVTNNNGEHKVMTQESIKDERREITRTSTNKRSFDTYTVDNMTAHEERKKRKS